MEGGRIVQYGPPQDIVLKPANDYVREFVAHMNPLNVLTGDVMMTPLPTLKRIGPMLMLDDDLGLTVALDNAGAAERAALGEHQLKIFESNGEATSWPRGEVVVMPHSAPMRVVIDARDESGLPSACQEGRIMGRARRRHLFRPAGPGPAQADLRRDHGPHPLLEGEDDPVVIVNADGPLHIFLVCEHAGRAIPGGLERSACPTADSTSHRLWHWRRERGAAAVAAARCAAGAATLFPARPGLRRPPEAASAMPRSPQPRRSRQCRAHP